MAKITKTVIMDYFRNYTLPMLEAVEYNGASDRLSYQIDHNSTYGGYALWRMEPGTSAHWEDISRKPAREFYDALRAYTSRRYGELRMLKAGNTIANHAAVLSCIRGYLVNKGDAQELIDMIDSLT